MTAKGSCFVLKPQRAAGLDLKEVRRALGLFADPTAGVFVQGLPWAKHETPSGGDLDACVKAVERCAGLTGTYFGLNPCPVGVKSTDAVVLSRRWLLFDFDSTPAHTEKRNATDEEREEVRTVAANAADYLLSRGWSPPVMVDSGNGTHLLYRVDMPNDRLSKETVKVILEHVAVLFDTPAVHLGDECHDARRISKLPGTWAKRGGPDASGGRFARIVSQPYAVEVIPTELLNAFATEIRKQGGVKAVPPTVPPERGPVFILRQGGDYTAYAKAALAAEASRVQMAPAGGRNTIVNDAAFRCGTMVGSGWITAAEVEGELELAAHKCGLMDDPDDGVLKTMDTIRRAVRDGSKHPRQPPAERNGKHEQNSDDTITVLIGGEVAVENTAGHFAGLAVNGRPKGPKIYELLTVGDILARELPEPNWAIPGLLSEGLNLLAGSPKMGKSMLALNLGLTVAGGGKALDDIQTAAGDVLYLSLEDKLRRVKTRTIRMLSRLGRGDVNRRLTITTEWPRADQGGLVLLTEWVKRVERPTLLIIDVLGRFRPPSRERGNQYEQDYAALCQIKEFVDKHNFSALVLCHTRKARSNAKEDDEFEEISGTQGIGGACDGMLLLRRSRQSKEGTVSITGRDGGERKLALEFNEDTFSWRSLGSAEEYVGGKVQTAIMDYLKARNGVFCNVPDVALAVQREPGEVRKLLHNLLKKGLVAHRGFTWSWPGAGEAGDTESF